MAVYLESYSVPKAPKLGIDLHDLVRAERDWLQATHPGTVERYRSLPKAIRNVARIATNKVVQAYVIRNSRHLGQAIGIATVIPNRNIIHPDKGWLFGTNIDYWLKPTASVDTHALVTDNLVRKSARIAIQECGQSSDHGMWAPNPMLTVVPEDTRYNLGIQNRFEPFGDPDVISTPDGQDPYGITGDGATVQVYRSYMVARQDPHGNIEA